MKTPLLVSLAALSLSLGAAPAFTDSDLKIGVAGPMTGPVAAIGEQMKRGAEAAAAAINEAGGVDGRKIKIVIEDDACDPKQAVAVANRSSASRSNSSTATLAPDRRSRLATSMPTTTC